MSTISKVFTVVNIVLALFLLGSVTAILSNAENYKQNWTEEMKARQDDVDKLQNLLADATGEAGALRSDLGLRNQEKMDLEAKLAAKTEEASVLSQRTESLGADVGKIQNTLNDLQNTVDAFRSQNEQLMKDSDQYKQDKADAELAQRQAEEDRTRLEGDIARLEGTMGEQERQLTSLSEERDGLRADLAALVALGVDVNGLIGNRVDPIDGVVSKVGPGFVVLSVGENDGVHLGYPFEITRGGDYIGRVIVDQLYPDNCVARVHMTNGAAEFRAQDLARTRL